MGSLVLPRVMLALRFGIVDIGMGNLHSVLSAMKQIGVEATTVNSADRIGAYTHLILPGVGSFREASSRLESTGIGEAIRGSVREGAYLLGICLGMQLLGTSSTEDGVSPGLGLIEFDVERFSSSEVGRAPIPHVGFSSVSAPPVELFEGIPDRSAFYFVHSYRAAEVTESTWCAHVEYGSRFVAAAALERVVGTQFHPEKSQGQGLRLLRNFALMGR